MSESVAQRSSASLRRNSLLTVAIGNFLAQMAMMPVTSILPTIAGEFKVALDVVSWVMTAYLIALTGWMLVAGRLGDLFGHRRVYLLGLAGYLVTGALCGLAQNVLALILFRAVQGVGAAMMLGNSLAILVHAFPARQHGRVIGVAMMAASLGSIFGVFLAATAITQLSWRWLFFALLPLGLVGLLAAVSSPGTPTPHRQRRVDWQGALLLVLALTAASLSLTHLHGGEESFEAGWPYHTFMQLLSISLFTLFAIAERRAIEPMVLVEYFRNWRFSLPLLAHGIQHMVMMGVFLVVPFVVERGLGLASYFTAIVLIARQSVTVSSAPVGGWLYDRTRSPIIAPIALSGIALSLGLLGLAAGSLDYGILVGLLIPTAVFVGLFMPANNTPVMAALPSDLKGFASGMLETARQFGHTMGASVVSAVVNAQVANSLGTQAEAGAYLAGFQHSVLIMAGLSLLGVAASIAPLLLPHREPEATALAVGPSPGNG